MIYIPIIFFMASIVIIIILYSVSKSLSEEIVNSRARIEILKKRNEQLLNEIENANIKS